jgi:hypothetical protein
VCAQLQLQQAWAWVAGHASPSIHVILCAAVSVSSCVYWSDGVDQTHLGRTPCCLLWAGAQRPAVQVDGAGVQAMQAGPSTDKGHIVTGRQFAACCCVASLHAHMWGSRLTKGVGSSHRHWSLLDGGVAAVV